VEVFYTAQVVVNRLDGVHRRARLPTGHDVDFGVHGPIKEHYRIDAPNLPLPVDYIAASTGA
jgi:hypothetical protein